MSVPSSFNDFVVEAAGRSASRLNAAGNSTDANTAFRRAVFETIASDTELQGYLLDAVQEMANEHTPRAEIDVLLDLTLNNSDQPATPEEIADAFWAKFDKNNGSNNPFVINPELDGIQDALTAGNVEELKDRLLNQFKRKMQHAPKLGSRIENRMKKDLQYIPKVRMMP